MTFKIFTLEFYTSRKAERNNSHGSGTLESCFGGGYPHRGSMTSQCAEWWWRSGRHRSSGDSTGSLSLFRTAPRVAAGFQGRLSVCDCCRSVWTVDPMSPPKSSVPRATVITSRKRLYLAALIGNLIYVVGAVIMIWNSQATWVTKEQNSWLGSLTYLGATVGPLFGGTIVDSLGRKPTVLAVAASYLIALSVLSSTKNIWALYTVRFIGGMGIGLQYAAMPAYLAEICDDEVRNPIGSLNQLFACLGLLLVYATGLDVTYIAIAILLIFVAAFSFLPETPYFLVSKGRREEAIRSLCWFRSAQAPQVEKEVTSIQDSLEERRSNAGKATDLLTKRGPRKALLIAMWAMLCQQVTGVNPVILNVQAILASASTSISAYLSSIIVAVATVISSLFTAPIVRWFGLKPVLILSGYAMSLSLFGLSAFLYMKDTGHNVSSVFWLPIILLVTFNFFFCIGVAPLPWAATAELLSGPLVRPSSVIIGVWTWTLAFGIMQSYETVVENINLDGTFLMYGIAEGVAITLLAFILPNTKGLSLQEIQDLLDKPKRRRIPSVSSSLTPSSPSASSTSSR